MNLQKMLKQAQEMQSKLAEAQAKMETQEFEGASGGGMVKVTINGKGLCLRTQIDSSLLVADEREVLEDLVVAAYNDALGKKDAAAGDALGAVTAGLPLPPGFKMPF